MVVGTRRSVVVGLDRSEAGRAAVEQAAELAVRRKAPLRLVRAYEASQYQVGPVPGAREGVHELLRGASSRLVEDTLDVLDVVYPDLETSVRLEPGSAVKLLVEESRTADVVVVGARGSGGFADLVLGSTTLHLTSQAHCPVLAVPVPVEQRPHRHGVVVGVDGSAVSTDAVGVAFEWAAELHEPLHAVNAWTDPARSGGAGVMMPLVFDPELVEAEQRRVVAETTAGWAEKYPDVQLTTSVLRGHPVRTLTSAATYASLLVVGSRGRSALASTVLGSVSHGVLHHATGPVLVVRHES
jgi:nucleotide-binding universal stress UspA family protein